MLSSLSALILALVLINAPAFAQSGAAQPPAPSSVNEELWDAARAGDAARVTKALEKGADVNAKTRYGATALTFAADKGHVAIVKLLLDKGADVNAQDTFYTMRAVDMAMMNKHVDVVNLLLERGSKGAGNVLMSAVQQGDVALAKTALASSDLTRANVTTALGMAKRGGNAQMLELLNAKLASMPAESGPPPVTVERSTLQTYVGAYRNANAGMSIAVTLPGDQLTITTAGQPPLTLVPTSQTAFPRRRVRGSVVRVRRSRGNDRADGPHPGKYDDSVRSDQRGSGGGDGGASRGRSGRSNHRPACQGSGLGAARRTSGASKLAGVPR